ncbi:MAG: hypothetical protein V3T49_03095, partial [Dehalococcoidia bacterium]
MRTTKFLLTFLATVGVLLLVSCSSDADSETAATPEPTAATTVDPADEPEQTVDEFLLSIESRVEKLRGIDTPPPLEHSFVDNAFMRELLAEELADPEVVEQLAHESALLKLLGMIPQDSDLGAIYESMLGAQVLGLYDPEKEEFFVLDDSGLGPDSPASGLDTEGQLTYAHEYVHRLQDAEFDLETIDDLAPNDDMKIAIAALVEGDATNAQTQYMFQNFDFLELAELMDSVLRSQADLPEAPPFLQQSLEFPYLAGAEFVAILMQMGGNAAVDAVFRDLPRSTEQILHPEKYFDREEPVVLDIPDDAMGDGWSVQAENVLGELLLKIWLTTLGSETAEQAAAGWGGDAYAIFEDGVG